jgi:hypothetical protein
MRRFLRRRGFRTLRLTQCNLSENLSRIGTGHVLLVSQLILRNEGTWGVIYNHQFYHNFALYDLEPFSFLNKPILSAYLIVHPKWRQYPLTQE